MTDRFKAAILLFSLLLSVYINHIAHRCRRIDFPISFPPCNLNKYSDVIHSNDIETYEYTQPQKKPDTFLLVLTRKIQIIELKVNAYFNSKTLKRTFEENLFIKYRT